MPHSPSYCTDAPTDVLYRLKRATDVRYDTNLSPSNGNHSCYTQSTLGSTECSRCRKRWTSGRVAVDLLFRKSNPSSSASVFHIVIYKQQCQKCETWETPDVDDDDWDTLIDRFSNVLLFPPSKDERGSLGSTGGPPHPQENCGKCRSLGRPCWEASGWTVMVTTAAPPRGTQGTHSNNSTHLGGGVVVLHQPSLHVASTTTQAWTTVAPPQSTHSIQPRSRLVGSTTTGARTTAATIPTNPINGRAGGGDKGGLKWTDLMGGALLVFVVWGVIKTVSL